MARTPLNKAELSRKKRQLQTFQRFLPALEMKRKQLIVACQREREHLERARREAEDATARAGAKLPMLADTAIPVENLMRVAEVELGRQNVVGVELPTLAHVELAVTPYGYLALPPWVDDVVAASREIVTRRVEIEVARARLTRLEAGLRTVTKRVNLFERILIPRTKEHIKRIEIALGDAERAAVVRAKIAKRKRAEAAS